MLLNTNQGKIEAIVGCMKSGKTNELIRKLVRAQIAGLDVMIFKPSEDDRFSKTEVISRTGRKLDCFSVNNLSDSVDFVKERCDVIGIDEIQFFDLAVVGACQEIANSGVTVIFTGLTTDFLGEPFETVRDLLPVAEEITKLSAICSCGSEANFSQRIDTQTGEPILSGSQVIVGDENYQPKCRKCFSNQG